MEERQLLRNGAMGRSNTEVILLLIREGQQPGEWGPKTVNTCSFFRGLSMTGIDKGYRGVCSYGLRQGEVKGTGRGGEEDPGVGI